MEYKVDIGEETYNMSDLKEVTITHPLFDKVSFGNACAAELTLTIWPKGEIPRMAKITPWVRDTGEWQKLGGFWLDTRDKYGTAMKIVAYDAMLRADTVWQPDQSLEFPMTMPNAAKEIARLMGVELDPRNKLNASYTIDYPANDYTLRDVLCFMAAAHGGNWIMTNEEKLLLIPLFGMPEETHYLIDEYGSNITFGGTRILV